LINSDANFNHIDYAFVVLGQAGGKQSIAFNKLGHYVSLFNTAQTDLGDARKKLNAIGNNIHKITNLKGYEGANKIREIGQVAV